MKKMMRVFCLTLVCWLPFNFYAQQIPNGDFEEWFVCLCDPPYWVTNNIYPPLLDCSQVFGDDSSYSGNFCIKGIVDSCPQLVKLRPPLIQSSNIPLNSKPAALHGFYKFFPVGNDRFTANIKVYKNNVLTGEGSFISVQPVANFTEFITNIAYISNDTPDVAIIKFTIDSSALDNKLHQGSMCFIDYLTFGPLSYSDNDKDNLPSTFILYQNFPNPFNATTTIRFGIPEKENVSLSILNILGEEIRVLLNEENQAGYHSIDFDANKLPSGVYFYRIQSGNFIDTKKMLLLK
jgi:hypothetical protein